MSAKKLATKKKLTLIQPLLKESERLGVSVSVISKKNNILKFSLKEKFFYSVGDTLPFCRKYKPEFIKNKEATKDILSEYGLSVPKGIRARSFKSAQKKIKENKLEFPLILKPLDGLRAYGVSWNIDSYEKLENAVVHFEKVRSEKKSLKSNSFLVEEQFNGREYRVLVLDNKAIACARKIPATVIGDGTSTIAKLIDVFNEKRKENFKIIIDDVVTKELKRNRISLETVPQKNERVQLRSDMMLAHGGRAIDYTQKISQELNDICVQAAQAVGLQYAGIDILIEKNDEKMLIPHKYKIIEVNTFPGHILNEAPLVEKPTVNVSKILLQYFLEKN
jgi:cyanophycin synthetase